MSRRVMRHVAVVSMKDVRQRARAGGINGGNVERGAHGDKFFLHPS